ncbi:MAG TPA: asparagine synthase-related protein, partial [Usitatibacter sp.]|nr:asparagine synthase-related protein [Usitatibacter sp.]
TLPATVKLRGGTTKWILKKALRRVLPDDILYRSKKGFGVPIGDWFRRGMLDSPKPADKVVSAAFIEHRLARHRAARSDERMVLWGASVLDHFRPRRDALAAQP